MGWYDIKQRNLTFKSYFWVQTNDLVNRNDYLELYNYYNHAQIICINLEYLIYKCEQKEWIWTWFPDFKASNKPWQVVIPLKSINHNFEFSLMLVRYRPRVERLQVQIPSKATFTSTWYCLLKSHKMQNDLSIAIRKCNQNVINTSEIDNNEKI